MSVMCHCSLCTVFFYCKNVFSDTINGFWASASVLEERVESGAADEEMVVLKGLRKVYLGYDDCVILASNS